MTHDVDSGTSGIRRAAIVGAGPAGVIAFAALRYRGLPGGDVTVYDDRPALSAWTERTEAILQTEMRSESDGHMFPTDFPGFALLDSIRRRSPGPLIMSAVNRYHPSREDIQRHGIAIAQHFELGESLQPARVARVTFAPDPVPHAVLHDASGQVIGRALHVLLGLGHGALRWPDALVDPGSRDPFGHAVVHAYSRKSYGDRTYLVIGSGMAAAAEWANILGAGGRVIALRRNANLVEQPLSAPRCYFGGPLLDQFHGLARQERAELLRRTARGSYPSNSGRERLLQTAIGEGRMESRVGILVGLAECDGRIEATLEGPDGVRRCWIDVVIAATGFESGWPAHPVLRDLVSSFHLDTDGEFMVLNGDCTVPLPSDIGATVTVSGPAARWVYPPADSFAGMKYVARRFADTVFAARAGLAPGPLSWWRLVRAGSPRRLTGAETENLACASP